MPAELEDRGDDFTASEQTLAVEVAAAVADAAANTEEKVEPKAEATAEETAAAEAAAVAETQARDEKGKFTKDPAIPKARVDQMVEKEKLRAEAAERENAELRAKLTQQQVGVKVGELEAENKEHELAQAKAILDGNAVLAAELAGKIRMNERQINNASTSQMSAEAQVRATEEFRMDLAIDHIESTYPALDKTSEEYDQDAVDMVLATQSLYIDRDRMTASQALTAAAAKVMGKLSTPKAEATTSEKPTLDDAKKGSTRKEEQTAKNIVVATKQPASTKDTGIDSDKLGIQGDVDMDSLSYEEFDALPEATKSRMRGDSV